MHMIVLGHDPDSPEWLESRLAEASITALRFDCVGAALAHPATAQAIAGVIESGRNGAAHDVTVSRLRVGGFRQSLLVLSAQSDWRERVRCFDAGLDDYLLKPMRGEELIARLRAMIRRKAGENANTITAGPFTFDLASNAITLEGRALDLTRNELRLLRAMLLRPDRILSHDELGGLLYPEQAPRSANAIEVHIARLRRKIGPGRIGNVRGIGYRLV